MLYIIEQFNLFERPLQYKTNNEITYRNGELYIEETAVSTITKQVGSPVYIYSSAHFTSQYNKFLKAFAAITPRVFFASKANFNISVIALFNRMGSGVDVNSAGELYRTLHAGVKPENIIFAGVGKTDAEITYALSQGILMIKSESLDEVEAINRLAAPMQVTAPVALRVNPDVDPQTHPYISTSLANNKFGISFPEARAILTTNYSNIRFVGLDMHLGSQILTHTPYLEAVGKMADFIKSLQSEGVVLHHLDLGGGFGVGYRPEEQDFDFSDLPEELAKIVNPLNMQVFFEPGRFLTANGGILVSTVLYTKQNGSKQFAIMDAAMTELMRPVLYNAYHHIQPVFQSNQPLREYDVVGPVCESSDFFAKSRFLPVLSRGEQLAILSCGAYADVMSSNYNARFKPPIVLVNGAEFRIIRRLEQPEDLIHLEQFS